MTRLPCRAFLGVLLAVAGCVHRPPRIEGGPGAPAAPNEYWPSPSSVTAAAASAERTASTNGAARIDSLRTVGDVVDIALRNNPATRLSWAQARAAADAYGASRGPLLPTLSLDVGASRARSLASPGRPAGERTQYGPSIGLSYLVLDFGGRSGNITAARQTAVAANLTHNVTVQNTILGAELALFTYLSTRSLRDAERVAVQEATASLNSAEERRRVGLATVADVLQARTARSQAQLALESFEGAVQVAHGGLAVAMGLPPTTTFEITSLVPAPSIDSLQCIVQSVDTLIATAVRMRPDLAAVRAQAAAAAAEVRVARGGLLPTISLNANPTYTASNLSAFRGQTYTVSLGFDLPLFSGFARQYNLASAEEDLQAANARADVTRQQVALQVFTAYYTAQTAAERVRTAADLLASASESESVARGRYREGVGSIVDLLIAQSALADARAQDAQARWQWRGAMAQLAHDIGVLGIHGESK